MIRPMRLSRFLPLALVAASFAAVPATAQVFYKPPAFAAKPIMALEPGFDPAMPGATPAEQKAVLTWSLRQALLLGALQCHTQYPTLLATGNYNALLTNHGEELTKAFNTISGYFKRTRKAPKAAQAALDAFATKMTTSYSTVRGQLGFCHTAGWVGRRALFTPRGQLSTLATEHLGELREALKPSMEQQFRGASIGSWLYTRRFPSFDAACWDRKNRYNLKKCS
jgi:hypothetical protein